MFLNFLPNNLDDYVFHQNQIKLLKLYNKENFPNILLYGKKNSGKKTLIKNYIKYLFNVDKIDTSIKEYKLKINNNEVKITIIQSLYYFEINLYEYGLYDKHVLCDFVKDLLNTKTVLNNLRILVINNLDKNTKYAQLALRRIIEKTCKTARFFIICDSITKIDRAIVSRCFNIRLPMPSKQNLHDYIVKVSNKLNLNYDSSNIKDLIKNCKRDLFVLNTLILTKKFNFNHPILFYIKNIWTEINKPGIKFLPHLRIIIYKLHLLNYDDAFIIKHFLNYINDLNVFTDSEMINISCEAALNEYSNHIGKKPFFNLEKLFIFVKRILINKTI